MVYIFLGVISLLVFFAVVSDNVTIGGSVGNVMRNAPHIVTIYTTVLTVFGLLIATAFYNNAALRDHNNNFNEILFSTSLSKPGYFFGRFLGALLMATVPMLGVFLGVFIGTFLAPIFGWIDADRFGPFFLETFINNYFLFILPNMFIAGSIIYALANRFKSTVISFVGAMIFIVGYIVSGTLLSDIDNETIAALADPFGISAYEIYSKYFTPAERNMLSPGFNGLLLWNRLLWIGIGLIFLLLSYFTFSFREKNKKVKAGSTEDFKDNNTFELPVLNQTYGKATEWLQFKSFFKINFLSIIKSVTFKILFAFSAIILIANLSGGYEYFGLQSYPVTYKIIDTISGASGIFIVIILVFFSGELIWRDRDNKINEVVDATPHTSFVSLIAKALSLVSVTTILYFFFIICGILYQLGSGFTAIDFGVYIKDFFMSDFVVYLTWSGLMVMVQVLVNNKYIGYFVSILLIFVWDIGLLIADIQSNMLSIASGPSTAYSDMNGFGPGLTGSLWFNAYWILFGIVSLLIAGALSNRGMRNTLAKRFKIAKKQIPNSYKMVLAATVILFSVLAGYVYYNTQVLNPYKTGDELEELSAEYEKKYKKYESAIHPKITDAKYFVDIFPNKRDVYAKTELQLVNKSTEAIDSLHFSIDRDWNPKFKIPNATLSFEDKEQGYLIYTLKDAMQPGDTMQVEIKTEYITKGFKNDRGNTNIVKNGTFLNNFEILPSMGYAEGREISDKNDRKKYDLLPKKRMPALEANCSDNCMANYLTRGTSDYINIESIVSTSGDQIAVAPGSLIKKWEKDGRNYFNYKVDTPSQHFYSFISAKFEVAKREWNGVDIEVYYDKQHGVNVENMIDAVERSLAYYSENFGPYMHKQCRIIEFPRYASFAQAFPGTMPYSEAIGFIINLEDETENNVVDAVIAHEMAHQWWAHQVAGANMQGATLLSESFSEYSSLMTMKSISKTPMKMRDFLKYDHERYLRGRSGELEKELPIYKVENQQYIHYGKGSVILYALQDYIGEDSVNVAMKSFLEEFRYKATPYPTSLDFIRHLEPRVPDSLHYLIKDWIKEITLYDNRLKEATFKKLDNGKYEVSMSVEAYKMKADSLGNENKTAIDDWIDIGVFADSDEKELIYEKRVKIDQEKMDFTFQVDSLPAKVAIDPRRILIDRVYKDNVKVLEEK